MPRVISFYTDGVCRDISHLRSLPSGCLFSYLKAAHLCLQTDPQAKKPLGDSHPNGELKWISYVVGDEVKWPSALLVCNDFCDINRTMLYI